MKSTLTCKVGYPNKRITNLLLCVILFTCFGCGKNNSSNQTNLENIETKDRVNFDLIIGDPEQPIEHQLGDPIGIRTDLNGRIYIADRSALKIKVFDQDGAFIKNIGRRGRGPAEFNDINMFEITPDGDFVIVDKGNLRFTSITKEGEEVYSTPIEISEQWQYYPDGIAFIDDQILGLYLFSGHATAGNIFERKLFHVSSPEFEEVSSSFLSYNELESLNEKIAWVNFMGRSGSFAVHPENSQIIYSPYIYTGTLYTLNFSDNNWSLGDKITGFKPSVPPFESFNEEEFESLQNNGTPGIQRIYYDRREPYMSRVNSADAGIYFLSDGRLAQFRSEWIDDKNTNSNGSLSISVQIFDKDYNLQENEYLFSIDATSRPWRPTVNWKDENDNFYVIDNSKGAPTIKRFSLDKILE